MSKNSTIVLSNALEQYSEFNSIEDYKEREKAKRKKAEINYKQWRKIQKMQPNKIKKVYSSKPKKEEE